jgi:hypothetical protein
MRAERRGVEGCVSRPCAQVGKERIVNAARSRRAQQGAQQHYYCPPSLHSSTPVECRARKFANGGLSWLEHIAVVRRAQTRECCASKVQMHCSRLQCIVKTWPLHQRSLRFSTDGPDRLLCSPPEGYPCQGRTGRQLRTLQQGCWAWAGAATAVMNQAADCLRNPLEPCGTLWILREPSGTPWNVLELYRT